ncbi:uncharacterized protein TA16060 [Theileria annulata]|uniref:Uncharacterized protein n=1 Tax=Theileria annulata TaxID=5874 RepID=Q4UDG9_THEAN|nr:uncharacterized protein TA16060 [Theileria annulata]CAI74870.1 hypothetical protein TA16060 [Theileria annulata]|eukprot:XP_952602.1 hypothetical protein TA16060 [Theileria annulata]
MLVLFRLEDSQIFSNLHSVSKRCVISSSADNQICLTLVDKIYTFKYDYNNFKLTSKATSSSIPRDFNLFQNQTHYNENSSSYYHDIQKLMCAYSVSDCPRFVWACWTPKFKVTDTIEVCILCTITINNSINLWLPSVKDFGGEIYNLENLLDVSSSIVKFLSRSDLLVFNQESDKEQSKSRILFNLSSFGFSSCQFLSPGFSKNDGFLCIINLCEYLLIVWISKSPAFEEKNALKEESRGRRSTRERKKINFEDLDDYYEEEEPVKKKGKKSQKVLGLSGFSPLNKDYYDLDDYDLSKCKDQLPPFCTVTQSSNPLHCNVICAVKVNSCVSFVALPLDNFKMDVYYSDSQSLKKIELKFSQEDADDFSIPRAMDIGKTIDIFQSNVPVECLKFFRLFGSDEYHAITGYWQTHFLVHFISENVTRDIITGNLPISSYSLEPTFMAHDNLARINVINCEGHIFRLLIDKNLSVVIEEVEDKKEDFVHFFTTSEDQDIMAYDCLLNGSIMEVKANFRNKSIFINLVLLLQNNSDLDLFLDCIALNKSNLVPNDTFFTLVEAKNPFYGLENADKLLHVSRSDDPFFKTLTSFLHTNNSLLKNCLLFVLYLFAFIEASDSLPFDQNKTVVCNLKLDAFLSKSLSNVSITSEKLVKIIKRINNLYKNELLSNLVVHLANS